MRKPQALRIGVGGVLALCLSGCGMADADGLPREPVSGKVTFDGKPLVKGTVQFLPIGAQARVQVGTVITDGTFSIDRESGPVPGEYKVAVTGSFAAEVKPNMEEGPPDRYVPPSGTVPPQYNANTTLTAKVEKAGDNRFEFDLVAPTQNARDSATTVKPGRRTTGSRARPRKG